jgi:hypothetical protein
MATNDIILMKLDASSDWNEVKVTAESGKALAFDGSVLPVMITPLQNLVEDTTPQLGGDLDMNGKTFSARTVLTTDGTYDFNYILSATVDTNGVGVGAVLAIASDGHWDEADADAIANCYGIGIALETGTGTKKIGLFGGQICVTAWNWTVGTPVYLSATQGTMTQTAPTGADDVVIILGFALSADTILFSPYINHITHVGA